MSHVCSCYPVSFILFFINFHLQTFFWFPFYKQTKKVCVTETTRKKRKKIQKKIFIFIWYDDTPAFYYSSSFLSSFYFFKATAQTCSDMIWSFMKNVIKTFYTYWICKCFLEILVTVWSGNYFPIYETKVGFIESVLQWRFL